MPPAGSSSGSPHSSFAGPAGTYAGFSSPDAFQQVDGRELCPGVLRLQAGVGQGTMDNSSDYGSEDPEAAGTVSSFWLQGLWSSGALMDVVSLRDSGPFLCESILDSLPSCQFGHLVLDTFIGQHFSAAKETAL
jgi:hypothetical protein